jgi:hypothetical protein
MIREDARGRLVAIVADFLVNPQAAFYTGMTGRPGPVLDVLVEDGWGLMKTPSHLLPASVGRPAAATIAGDASDYRKHGYDVVILAAGGLPQGGVWLDELVRAFNDLEAPMPPVVTIGFDEGCRAEAIRDRLAARRSAEHELQPARGG